MAYRFNPQESVNEAVTRCAREQLDRATRELSTGTEADPVKAVHSARKALKKERSLLRLIRGAVPSSERNRANAALRDAARGLSSARDADVMVQALDEVERRFAGQLPRTTFSAVRDQLELASRSERASAVGSAASAAVKEFASVQARIDGWTLERGGWRAIDPGLTWTYRRGRKAHREAQSEPSLENLHDWRKRVKDLWYQLQLLAPVCGPAVRGQAKDAHRLADLLGDDHDLGVLRATLERMRPELAVDIDALLRLLDVRREQLVAEATHVGERVYPEKPAAFRRRIRRQWKAGRAAAREHRARRPVDLAEVTRAAGAA